MKITTQYLYIFLIIWRTATGLEPFTTTAIGLGIVAGVYNLFFKCMKYECCNDDWIKFNHAGLQETLDRDLHGQHIVKESVMKILRHHFFTKQIFNKPLVMSFHGFSGTGKNHVSRMIIKNIFKDGLKSAYVKMYVAPVDFPVHEDIDYYKRWLIREITTQARNCDRSVFIFDEVDKMPPTLMDTVRPFMEHHASYNGVSFSKIIFILLSNTGATAICKKVLDVWEKGLKREDITIHDMHNLIHEGAFNEAGGLYKSNAIEKNVIDYYIPFLPLERSHVKLCARDALRLEKIEPTEERVNWVADKMSYEPNNFQLYSKSGCKRVAEIAGLVVEKYLEEDDGLKL